MKRLTGIILIAISAASFGALAIFGRYAYTAGMDTFTVLFLRFSIAAILMASLLMARRESLPRGRVLGQLIGMGALGYVGQSFMYLTAINYASAGLVASLLYLYPYFVMILEAIQIGVHDRGMQLADADLGRKIQAEKGIENALNVFENILRIT